MDMKKQTALITAIFTLLATQNIYAQDELRTDMLTATSTPFSIEPPLTEEERTKALISEDRPVLQSYVELEEQMKDSEIDQEDAEHQSKRHEKMASKISKRQKKLEKLSERLTVVSDTGLLQEEIDDLEVALGAETDPTELAAIQATLISKSEDLGKKQSKIIKLDEKIASLNAKIVADEQAIVDQIEAYKAKLESKLTKMIGKQAKIAEKIEALTAKRASTTNATKVSRIGKQLANNQLRAAKIANRVAKLNSNLEEIQ